LELPAPYLRLVPELAGISFPAEPLATCASCAMATRDDPDELVFDAPARCCTYHPSLPNFAVGRVLRAGGLGAERVRARIASGDGLDRRFLGPPASWKQAWSERAADGFGRDRALTCPYWVDGVELACSVHAEREAVCRTWHCKVQGGERAQHAWIEVRGLLARIERTLAEACARAVATEEIGVDPAKWEAFYRACADHLDALPDDRLVDLRTAGIAALLDRVRARIADRDAPMPDVLQPRLVGWWPRADGRLAVSSTSSIDREAVPRWIFVLLSRLDGVRTWRDALAEASAELGEPIPEALVHRLWDRGLLGPPIGADGPVTIDVSFVPGDPEEPPRR
jgi:hypothetical protein